MSGKCTTATAVQKLVGLVLVLMLMLMLVLVLVLVLALVLVVMILELVLLVGVVMNGPARSVNSEWQHRWR